MSGFENMSRIAEGTGDAVRGKVVWAPVKSLFLAAMYAATIYGVWRYLRIDTVVLFGVKTVAVLLLGHSVGMHRRLIHKSFACPKWLEHVLVYFGVLVGLGGPFAMIRTHDLRDWAQRQPGCHDYFAHRRRPLVDAWWQMHCDLKLERPPVLRIEDEVAGDGFYRLVDRHWILAHLPWVVVFGAIGGWAWVIWGVCAQVAVTVTGHWLIGWFAHQPHGEDWQVHGAGVQGRNVIFMRSEAAQARRNGGGAQSRLPRTNVLGGLVGWLTMGEGWHNNHHAFPGSARIGLYEGQSDPGYWLVKGLESAGLVWDVRLPEHLGYRPQLQWMGEERPVMLDDRKPCKVMGLVGKVLRV